MNVCDDIAGTGLHEALTTVAAFTYAGSIVTPNPGPLGQRTTPLMLFSGDVAHVTGRAALPLNSMYAPVFGVNDAK
jgi:hypothetical protein